MVIFVNGEKKEIDGSVTVAELLTLMSVNRPDMVSVELNGSILERPSFARIVVKEGDKVEFLYFMGGGTD